MKALLLKDLLVIRKTLLLYIIFGVVFTLTFPLDGGITIFCVYGLFIPITTMALDEQSKWSKYEIMLPFDRKTIVLSRYFMCYISLAVMLIVGMGAQSMKSLWSGGPQGGLNWAETTGAFLSITFLQAVILPLIYHFGVEKARIVMVCMAALVGAVFFISSEVLVSLEQTIENNALLFVGIGLAAVFIVQLVSIDISARIYKRKEL